MTHELKLELDEEWMSPTWLAANLRGRAGFMESTTGGSDRKTAEGLRKLAASIEEQVKPAVDEPTEFGSVISATCGGERMRWQQAQDVGYHYWRSITGVVEVWSELTDVEVLRVGLDGATSESYRKGFEFGLREMNTQAHQKIRALLADAITGERKNAFEKAIQAVEELAP